jgi:hypothetical protein
VPCRAQSKIPSRFLEVRDHRPRLAKCVALALEGLSVLRFGAPGDLGSTTGLVGKSNGDWAHELLLYINGKRVVVQDVRPEMTLLQFLRQSGLTGTKLGCGEVRYHDCFALEGIWV